MDIAPNLVEYFVKGHHLSFNNTRRTEDSVSTNINQVFASRTTAITDHQIKTVSNSQAAAVYPEATAITDDITRTFGGRPGSGSGIQALGVVGVMVLIFLVGIANGVRDKKKQKPK